MNKVITVITAICLLETLALLLGYNGSLLRVALVLIAGLGGFELARWRKKG